MKTTTLQLKHSMNRSHRPLALLLIPLALACFALSPRAQAVCQEGCLTNDNTALGEDALLNNTGFDNTAIGSAALQFNVTGGSNTAVGFQALWENTGAFNTAVGTDALMFNTTGNFNTATGATALQFANTGSNNAAYGFDALQLNRVGSNNTAVGFQALRNNNASSNTAVGNLSLTRCKGNSNIALGDSAGSNIKQTDNNIDIGNTGVVGDSNTIRIGNETHTATYIAGIYGQVVAPATGAPVLIDGSGRLGTMLGPISSARRFKHDIKAMDKASEAILALKPVTFRYKQELDPDGIPQFGLVAEEVEKVNPDLVARDAQGKPYTVRYEAVNAMLLNEFLKEHRKVAEQEATITQLKAELQATATRQQKQIEALTEGLQKVSAQLELGKAAPQIVLNNR